MIAIAFGTINIVGGFLVTDRMLGMFAQEAQADGRGGRLAWSFPRCSSRAATSRRCSTSSPSRCFIFGVRRGTHPRTAKQGNLIAAFGMAVAVTTTLLLDGIGNWGLLVTGIVIGTAVGVIASVRVQMTAMPQMVALYNGVGGGAVALIAWSEIRHGISEIDAGVIAEIPLDTLIPVLFSAVVGSVSFWGSNIAFAKLQGLIPTKPLSVPGQQVINAAAADRGDRLLRADRLRQRRPLADALHPGPDRRRRCSGNLVVLPIGGADMPVVISLLNAFTGLAAAAAGFALDNVALIVAGTLVGSSGTILTLEMATAMNRSVANILFAGFGGAPAAGARDRGGAPARLDQRPGRGDQARLRRLGRDRARLRARGRPGPARGQGDGRRAREARGHRPVRDPPGRRADARAT